VFCGGDVELLTADRSSVLMQFICEGPDSRAWEVRQYEKIDAAAAMGATKLLTLN
jgi:hypothetical protein